MGATYPDRLSPTLFAFRWKSEETALPRDYHPVIAELTVATWNIDWASRRSKRFEAANARISELAADLLILTETTFDLVPTGGHVVEGGPEWGYPAKDRRKVLLWSKWPLTDVANDLIEPAGRHVRATAHTPIGPIRIHGVCVPWSHSNVTWGRQDRTAWEEHLQTLKALGDLLATEGAESGDESIPVVVAGDFNQRDGPRPYGGKKVRDAWADIRATSDLTVATDDQVIDKVAVGPGLAATHRLVFPGEGVSDHSAVSCRISPA